MVLTFKNHLDLLKEPNKIYSIPHHSFSRSALAMRFLSQVQMAIDQVYARAGDVTGYNSPKEIDGFILPDAFSLPEMAIEITHHGAR